jgi:hypothetical protein
MALYTVFADLGGDRREFHGVFSTEENAEAHIEKTNKAYGFECCYWEETELDNP